MKSHLSLLGTAVVLAAATFVGSPAVAQTDPCAKEESRPTKLTPETIRERAKSIQTMRELLKDPDATVRLAALDATLTSCDAAMREVGYEIAFGSADQTMRALALKHRLLSMKQFVVELIPPENVDDAEQALIASYALKHPVFVGTKSLSTGDFSPQGNIIGTVSGLEVRIQDYNWIVRLRLGEGAVLMGQVSQGKVMVPARVVLR